MRAGDARPAAGPRAGLSRRAFVAATPGAALLLSACARGAATAGAPGATGGPASAGELPVYVGTYTDDTSQPSAGVYRFLMDVRTGVWRAAGTVDAGPNPSFVALHPTRPVLYAVNELAEYEGRASGAVRALALDRAFGGAGGSALLDRRATGGGAPCYVSLDRAGRRLLVANYLGGNVAAFPLDAAGRIAGEATVLAHAGRGPNAARQEGPHAHSILADPSNGWVVSADLGSDRVHVYRIGGDGGALAPASTLAMRPGAGPRHLAFDATGRRLYVVNELDLTLATCDFDPATGALALRGTVPLVSDAPPAPGAWTAADLHLAPDGRTLCASVRGADRLVLFALDAATGAPSRVQELPTGGRWPRNFGYAPSGRFLFAANQRSGTITGFAVDAASGRLTPTGQTIAVPAPVCIAFGRAMG